jgi:hypothetical protein
MQDECNAPWQVMLGSMNAVFCVFIMVGFVVGTEFAIKPKSCCFTLCSNT